MNTSNGVPLIPQLHGVGWLVHMTTMGEFMARLPVCLATAALAALAGCGQIAIKRGSGADALMADRASCRAQNADPAAVKICLVQHGWHITDLDGGPAATPAYPAAVALQPAPAGASPAPAVTPPPPPRQPVHGTDKIHVGTWWHFGGGPSDLSAAVGGCVSKLGTADQPDAGYHIVTRALYECLSAEGWRRAS